MSNSAKIQEAWCPGQKQESDNRDQAFQETRRSESGDKLEIRNHELETRNQAESGDLEVKIRRQEQVALGEQSEAGGSPVVQVTSCSSFWLK